MYKYTKKHQAGFTLIEIAIVMVIIGLLLGGVLKGQAMIDSARVRALNNNIDGISAAWFAFQDRYRVFPGDMLAANANAQIGAGVGAGNGGDGGGTVVVGAESGFLWRHLAVAGLISGSYSALTTGAAGVVQDCAVTICPDNRFGLGFVIANLAAPFPAAAHRLFTGSRIPVEIVAELDRKIDDGLPATGTVFAGGGGAAALCVAAGVYNIAGADQDCGLAIDNL